MTHNELYLIMLDSIGPLLLEVRRATFSLPNGQMVAYEAHKLVLDAIASRDPQAAREAMRKHLEGAEQEWIGLGEAVKLGATRAT